MTMLPLILGLSGPRLTEGERAFFRDANPWGFILFARNVETPDQLRQLTSDLRDAVSRNALIFIDQEGGRVRRLRPPHWRDYPSARVLASNFASDRSVARRVSFLHHRLIADDLRDLGITANCAPVLDIPIKGANPIISDRAFGTSAKDVVDMAHTALAGLMAGGVSPVIKHIPGHGRALVDSHLALPKISNDLTDLSQTDFEPFKKLCDAPMAMTAHIVYEGVESDRPLTTSKKGITRIIRGEIGFEGLLMSDDLDMKALSGSLTDKTRRALAAGCDIALQCSGKLPDMVKVAKGASTLTGESLKRSVIAENCAEHITDFDRQRAEAEFDAILSDLAEVA